jgi:hypothetical protein
MSPKNINKFFINAFYLLLKKIHDVETILKKLLNRDKSMITNSPQNDRHVGNATTKKVNIVSLNFNLHFFSKGY